MNKAILLGRLATDVTVKYTPNGTCISTFTLAVNRRFKQEGQPDADFISIVTWAKTAEFCGKYFNKGQQVVVEGRIQVRNYDNSEGKKIYVTEVVADAVYFADSKKESNNQQINDSSNNENQFVPTDNQWPF